MLPNNILSPVFKLLNYLCVVFYHAFFTIFLSFIIFCSFLCLCEKKPVTVGNYIIKVIYELCRSSPLVPWIFPRRIMYAVPNFVHIVVKVTDRSTPRSYNPHPSPQPKYIVCFFRKKRKRCRMFWNGKICLLMKTFAKYVHLALFYVFRLFWIFW